MLDTTKQKGYFFSIYTCFKKGCVFLKGLGYCKIGWCFCKRTGSNLNKFDSEWNPNYVRPYGLVNLINAGLLKNNIIDDLPYVTTYTPSPTSISAVLKSRLENSFVASIMIINSHPQSGGLL